MNESYINVTLNVGGDALFRSQSYVLDTAVKTILSIDRLSIYADDAALKQIAEMCCVEIEARAKLARELAETAK